MPFEDTLNKATIRRTWDAPVLAQQLQRLQRPLAYFGLTGPKLYDLLDWKNYIGVKTAVESIGHTQKQKAIAQETTGELLTNVMVNQLSSQFQLMRGDIEDIIIEGIDEDGHPPQESDGQPAHRMKFTYDIINLDFDGGLGYLTHQGVAKRTTAIKRLFERQLGHSFTLFLTVNVRDTLGDEIDSYLRELRKRNYTVKWSDQVDWYLSRPEGQREYKLKATIPSFIHATAEPQMFKSICRPPIVYDGHGHARMVHFVFELCAQPGNLRTFSDQDDRDLLAVPLLRCRDGELSFADTQMGRYENGELATHIGFLPSPTIESILDASNIK